MSQDPGEVDCVRTLTLVTVLATLTGSVCLGQFGLPAESAAKVITLEGRVSVLKDNYPWALNAGDSIQVRQVVISGPDGHAVFEVSDGSTFEVFPNSRVTFRANPGNWRDLVDVWLGRIRVHIQRPGGQPNPNKVQTPTAVISVRGTVFDVVVDPEDETTRVEVVEGEVGVEHKLMPREGGLKIIGSGESITVYRNVPLARGHRIDRGRVFQAAMETIWQVLATFPRTGGSGTGTSGSGGTGGGVTLPGDTGATPPPPPPPAPAPAPAPAPPPPPPGG